MENKNPSGALHLSRRQFFASNFKELDRELTEEQRAEWNAIYASYESRSLLRGTVIGIDHVAMPQGGNTEEEKEKTSEMPCLTVVQYRVKVLIPLPMIGREEYDAFALSSMVGAKIDYIVQGVDRDGECAVASRKAALEQQSWHARNIRHVTEGDIVTADILAVGPTRLTLTACGYDTVLMQAGLSYSFLGDLRQTYQAGQTLHARVLAVSDDCISVSVREAEPNPFEGAEFRHPVGSTRLATITGKYGGGIFGRLPDGCTVICKYAQHFVDDQFASGDTVLVQIGSISNDRQWLRGKIRGKV